MAWRDGISHNFWPGNGHRREASHGEGFDEGVWRAVGGVLGVMEKSVMKRYGELWAGCGKSWRRV